MARMDAWNSGNAVPDEGAVTRAVSIVMPCFGDGPGLRRAVAALESALRAGHELILVDDATPGGLSLEIPGGARILRRPVNGGPGAARNDGVRAARHPIVVFVDADVVVRADTVDRLATHLFAHPDLDAVFGAYDAQPSHPTLLSRWRNLLHHHTHQCGDADAETFWAGCGAMRRAAFDRVSGFDAARFPMPSVEDIDLGYRLRDAGCRILLDPSIQVTHLKAWTFVDVLRVDVMRRAIPWARMLVGRRRGDRALNVSPSQRVCGVLALLAVGAAIAAAALPVHRGTMVALLVVALAVIVYVNRRFFALLWRVGGWSLATAGIAFQWMFYIYGTVGFAVGTLTAPRRA